MKTQSLFSKILPSGILFMTLAMTSFGADGEGSKLARKPLKKTNEDTKQVRVALPDPAILKTADFTIHEQFLNEMTFTWDEVTATSDQEINAQFYIDRTETL